MISPTSLSEYCSTIGFCFKLQLIKALNLLCYSLIQKCLFGEGREQAKILKIKCRTSAAKAQKNKISDEQFCEISKRVELEESKKVNDNFSTSERRNVVIRRFNSQNNNFKTNEMALHQRFLEMKI